MNSMDVAPELYERVKNDFDRRVKENKTIERVMKKVNKGTADYIDGYNYATAVGRCLSNAFSQIQENDLPDGRMYYNIADRVVRPMLEEVEKMVGDVSAQIQNSLNQKAGIGLKNA